MLSINSHTWLVVTIWDSDVLDQLASWVRMDLRTQ